MSDLQVAPYGSWKSPITSDMVASEAIRLRRIVLDGKDNLYWKEMRPTEGGRNVIVRRQPDGQITDITRSPFNARTLVHEYGGGAFTVTDGTIYFSNFTDQRMYRQEAEALPHPITPEADLRYADMIIDPHRRRIICVREDHTVAGHEPVNTLVSIKLEGGEDAQILVSGNDFISSPRLNPDGSRLAWLTWNHSNMPWDGTELWVSELNADGSLGRIERVAGGIDESVVQPEWSPDGVLYFVSDRSGWWNIYRWHDENVESLYEMKVDFARPQWVFGMSTYAFESADSIICAFTKQGAWHLARLDTVTGETQLIEVPYTDIRSVRALPGQAVFIAGSSTEPSSIVKLDLAKGLTEVLRRSSSIKVDAEYLSIPKAIEFPTENGLTAHAFFYAPRNREYTGPSGKQPPLLVISHGGPTSATSTTLSWNVQYWTSRGIAVLDVNYGGSSGYGRAYRQRLNGQWGVVDVDDCVNGACHLVKIGEVDGDRLAIRGGSAGGYTTLCALTFRDIFRAGASYYGVSDLEALTKDTHKFESHYLDRMIGPYPERCDLYRERSPIHFVDRISCPIIFFQGLEDKVVPPSQAELMFQALREKGLPVAYIPFDGEQHGFRQAENIKRALDAELYFYSKIFGFEAADKIEPFQIENL
jgi:dipeptidyl aminopeptidase/acylaminoacyl peptidase